MNGLKSLKWTMAFLGTAVVAVVLGAWALLSINSPAGNLFAGSAPQQLLLYGRLFGLLAGMTFVFLLLSMGKGRAIERLIPKAVLVKLHRRLGFATLLLAIVHLGLIFTGRSMLYEESWWKVATEFATSGGVALITCVGLVILLFVLAMCGLFVRKKMAFAAWKKTHYFVYAAVLLLFFHQIAFGLDFAISPAFQYFWIAIFVLASVDVILWKVKLFAAKRA